MLEAECCFLCRRVPCERESFVGERDPEVFKLLKREPQGPSTGPGASCADIQGRLTLSDVSFRYPSAATPQTLRRTRREEECVCVEELAGIGLLPIDVGFSCYFWRLLLLDFFPLRE